METKPSSDNGARSTNTDVCCSGNGSVMVSLQLRFRRSPSGSCSLRMLRRLHSVRYNFPPNTSRLQSALHGSKPHVEVASARRKLPDDASTLPRLLMAVYTPLLRCATASDACNFA